MKNLILGFCLVGLAFACKSNDTATVDDAAQANLPNTEAGGCCPEGGAEKSECSSEGATKSECSGAAAKSECSGAADEAECSGAVCPVTGQAIE